MVAEHFAFRESVQEHPEPKRPRGFVLTPAEQAELLTYLWPQWINPNEFPILKRLIDRLEEARS